MKLKTPSTIVSNDWFPKFAPGWVCVGWCDEANAWIGAPDADLRKAIHGNVIGDDFLRVPSGALDTAGIVHDYYDHATHSADVLGFIAVRERDLARAMECLSAIGG